MTNLVASAPVDALRSACAGDVTGPGDAAYDAARQAWNLAADQRPAAVVRAALLADLAATVRVAREHGLRIAPQGTGHGAGALGPLDAAILLRTDELRGVEVDPVAQIARVQAGALWDDVLAKSAPHGLAPLAGSAGDVGVVGYHLGGGLSFLGRKYGVAAKQLLAATVITADGQIRRVDAESDPELLWGLRGGGSLGIVAEVEIALHAVPALATGQLFWPIERAREVLGAWRDWAPTAPREITTSARILRFPPDPALPEALRGGAFVVIDGAFLGDAAACEEALAPLRALSPSMDMFGPAGIESLTQLHMDPPMPVPVMSSHALLHDATDRILDELVALAGADAQTGLLMVELRQLGGAIAEQDGTAVLDGIQAGYALFACGIPMGGPVPPEALAAELAAVVATAGEQHAGMFANFTESPGNTELPHARDERLRALRTALDPDGLLLGMHTS
ncbi:MAG: FAD-binding oxidoreductase [Solirubrobacteraceae bacterium]|nr:FAD-binding oxidoreductase [Solirubrobacteraceae bacterium]